MGLIGILLFVLVQLIFFSGLVFVWMRMRRSMDDDSRWSRSLQFLQSKIAVFEDLSDRTETQVKQLTVMMENKICDLQRKIDEADEVLNKISNSMKKSMEVAEIFQDRIPHEEIIERQNTLKFVKAALMANEGMDKDEIAAAVDLPQSQIEFIVKVNSDRLSFDPGQMPEWLKSELNKDPMTKHSLFERKRLETIPDHFQQRSPIRPLQQIIRQRSMLPEIQESQREIVPVPTQSKPQTPPMIQFIEGQGPSEQLQPIKSQGRPNASDLKAALLAQGALGRKAKDMGIRPVVFPRIEMPR